MPSNVELRIQNRELAFAEFDKMPSQEFVTITRIMDGPEDIPVPKPFTNSADLMDDICRYTEALPRTDLPRALEVYRTLGSSSLATDRAHISVFMDSLTAVESCREEALDMWDKLLRDSDKGVRDSAVMYLEGCLNSHNIGYVGFEAVAMCDEEALANQTGLTRHQAEHLMLSYAYAENGRNLHYAELQHIAPRQ